MTSQPASRCTAAHAIMPRVVLVCRNQVGEEDLVGRHSTNGKRSQSLALHKNPVPPHPPNPTRSPVTKQQPPQVIVLVWKLLAWESTHALLPLVSLEKVLS
mmetsp:Transcript_27414/g.52212  ORF Transcript_27414/g.52212 Transcript_27414/m.52212 type:complete len:101 (+) Transcript_27414:1554-1856(+)